MVEFTVYKQNHFVLTLITSEPTDVRHHPHPPPPPEDAQDGSSRNAPRAPLGKMKRFLSRLSTIAQVERNNLRWSL